MAGVCSHPGCPHLKPCPTHTNPRNHGSRNPERDLVAHVRWARALKRATPYCQVCGTTENLQAHHTHGVHDPRGIVVCREHHKTIDQYAR